ncbi:ABC transporter ATP-binding protein [Halegenticoccus tardaugens]|uniref:ABC transporter ATP-binding protein n=1 Tax=Halegenticoccus tardaugens TaxID=2071624 RepID=UPI00100B4F05|nr:ABC transporter ATP-binding protein [Halegenticoccus tardaugens]
MSRTSSRTSSPAIELRGVQKQYGDVIALKDLDLTIESGEIFGFLGPNGAGKSTTIDILLDFVRPTDGSVRVLGLDAQTDSLAVRRRTGVLPDGYHVYDRLTGRQHLEFAIASKGVADDPEALLERVGLGDAAARKAGEYSKGMKQRLVLAMALVGEPELLILDEPSTGLDPAGAREMRRIIREERDRGATVFFSSHVLEQVEAVCDRVAILNAGELVAVDTIAGLRAARGADTTLTITVESVPAGLLDSINRLPGVTSVYADGTTVTVACEGARKTAVLRAIEESKAGVRDFETVSASLEDLFIGYTGADRSVVSPSPTRAPSAGPREAAR